MSSDAWLRFLRPLFIVLGAALLLAGVVCFFAAHWDAMARELRLAAVAVPLALCGIASLGMNLDDLPGQAVLAAVGMLAGVLLAVVEQTWPSTSAPWVLYATWAAILVPLALAARTPALWLMVLAAIDLAGSYGAMPLVYDMGWIPVQVAAVAGVAWLLWPRWFGVWSHRTVWLAAVVPVMPQAMAFLYDGSTATSSHVAVVLAGALVALGFVRRMRGLAVGAGLVLVNCVIWRVLEPMDEPGLLLMAVVICAQLGVALRGLGNGLPKVDLPLRLFACVGAWIAAGFLIAFMVEMDWVDNHQTAILLGCGVAVGACLIGRMSQRPGTFIHQLALAMTLAGQALACFGIFFLDAWQLPELADQLSLVLPLFIVVHVALIPLWRSHLHRFLIGIAVAYEAGGWLAMQDPRFPLHLIGVPLLLGAGWMLHRDRPWGEPFGEAGVVGLFGLLSLPLWLPERDTRLVWLTTVGVAAVFLIQAFGYWRRAGSPIRGVGLLVGIALLGALSWTTPGVVASLAVLMLARDRDRTALAGLAAASLATYLVALFYDLDAALLTKSASLAAVGVALLLARTALPAPAPETHEKALCAAA